MLTFEKCPICGADMAEKEVEKLLLGDKDTAVLKVKAEICLHCGECLYSQEDVRRFEQIRKQLIRHDISGLQPLGQSFQVI